MRWRAAQHSALRHVPAGQAHRCPCASGLLETRSAHQERGGPCCGRSYPLPRGAPSGATSGRLRAVSRRDPPLPRRACSAAPPGRPGAAMPPPVTCAVDRCEGRPGVAMPPPVTCAVDRCAQIHGAAGACERLQYTHPRWSPRVSQRGPAPPERRPCAPARTARGSTPLVAEGAP